MQNNNGVYQLDNLSKQSGISHGFSTNMLGNMSPKYGDDYAANMDKFWQAMGLDKNRVVKADLKNSDKIVDVINLENNIFECDALITGEKNIAIYFVIGDCIPILFYAPDKQVVAIAHCGWRGTDLHLAEKTAKQLRDEYSCDLSKLVIGFGPSIQKSSYVFDVPIEQGEDWQPYLQALPNGFTSIDVIGYNLAQLESLGIAREQIEVSTFDTATSPLFYSHYRALRSGEIEGRFVAAIILK
ncbi:MAG: polyphenol oxidase family protein [Candidatus Falkowbacteria bacterium]